jgi:hypothetical protein
MAAIIFWFVIVPFISLLLLWIFIQLVIPVLFSKATGAARDAMDRKFDKIYGTEQVTDRKLQRGLSLVFFGRWAMLLFGVMMMALPITKLIREGEMYLSDIFPYLIVGALGVGIFIFGIMSMRRTKQLAALIAGPVIRTVFGINSQYDPFGHVPEEFVSASGFVSGYENISGSDFVRGHYRGIPVMFSDLRLTRTEYSYNSETNEHEEHEVVLFKGLWLVADFNRELSSVPLTIVEERSASGAIQMESEAFNRQFSVFCIDDHTAFYILTPHFMERLVAVDASAEGKSHFKFDKNRLQIAVKTGRDLFETSSFKPPNVTSLRKKFQREIERLTTVLDEMLMHERLFSNGKDES